MSGKPEQEPSIEEILASIRQIISDDDEPPRDAAVDLSQEPPAKAEEIVLPAQEKAPEQNFREVLELTNVINDEEEVDLGFKEEEKIPEPVFERPAPPQEPKSEPKPAPAPVAPQVNIDDFNFPAEDSAVDKLFTEVAASATANAFSRLKSNVPIERPETRATYLDGITLEDIVKDMLRPMLREWINDNVPRLVERLVEKELEKLARQARDD